RGVEELLPGDVPLGAVLVGVLPHCPQPIDHLDEAGILESLFVRMAVDIFQHQVGRLLLIVEVRRPRLGGLVLPRAIAARAGLRRAVLAARVLLARAAGGAGIAIGTTGLLIEPRLGRAGAAAARCGRGAVAGLIAA